MPEQQAERARVGCGLGLLTLLVGMVLGVGLTLWLLGLGVGALFQGRSTGQAGTVVAQTPTMAVPEPMIGAATPGRRLVWEAPIPLDSDTYEPDLLVISRNYDAEPDTDTITYLNTDRRTVRWESPPLGENGNSWVVTYGPTMVLVADEARLVALHRDTGAQAWEAPLTDTIADSICQDCLQVFGDVVVALPQDGMLQAFDIATGAPRWQVRLRQPTRQLVNVGGVVGVPDEMPEQTSNGALYLYNPHDGSPAGEIVPSCKEPNNYERFVSYYITTDRDPSGRFLTWLVGSGPMCLMSYDITTGTINRTWIDDFNSGGASGQARLWADEVLYLNSGTQIFALSAQELRMVLSVEDYDLRLRAASPDTILIEAQRRRGSSRFELWAVDAATGERRWERVLTADDPLEDADDSGDFAATLVGDAIALFERQGERALVYELIGLADGASRARYTLSGPSGGGFIRGILWGRDQVFLAIDELYAVELSSGEPVLRWP